MIAQVFFENVKNQTCPATAAQCPVYLTPGAPGQLSCRTILICSQVMALRWP
jgi:hypothetical protein